MQYEYDVADPQTKGGVKKELNDRVANGWEFVAVYVVALGQKAHLIFRRPKNP